MENLISLIMTTLSTAKVIVKTYKADCGWKQIAVIPMPTSDCVDTHELGKRLNRELREWLRDDDFNTFTTRYCSEFGGQPYANSPHISVSPGHIAISQSGGLNI